MLEEKLKNVHDNMPKQLIPGKYIAVHCRVRHPKAIQPGNGKQQKLVLGKDGKFPADRSGLPWDDSTIKDNAIQTANTALQCARTAMMLQKPSQNEENAAAEEEPIYCTLCRIRMI